MIPNPPDPARGCSELTMAPVTSAERQLGWGHTGSVCLRAPQKAWMPQDPMFGTTHQGSHVDRHPRSYRKVARGGRAPWVPLGLGLLLELA